jgi:hypothetical protein
MRERLPLIFATSISALSITMRLTPEARIVCLTTSEPLIQGRSPRKAQSSK